MPRVSKKEINLKIVQSDSSICRASPYVLDLKKVYVKKEKVLPPKKANLFVSSLKDLSFVGPLYFLISLIFRFLKSSAKLFKTFFVLFGLRFAVSFRSVAAAAKKLGRFRISPQPILSKFKFPVLKIKWPTNSFSLPAGWSRAIASFLVISFLLISPFQALSYYGHFQNKLDKFGLNLVDILKLLPQKEGLEKALLISNVGKKILGYGQGKRYLVIFQNNNELRPTGGFIGSFALVDVLNGKIKKMEIPPEGSYALEGWLKENVIAPEPLHLVSSRWEFQDANWFPDFPASAEKMIWFYNKSGGPSVDGVIALTSDFFQNILKVFGPVEMPDYGKVINSENFDLEIQKAVEIEYDKKENKPKQIITDLAPKIIDKILASDSQQFAQLVDVLNKELTEKDLLFYFKDKEIQGAILNLGWAGEIKDTERESDYLMVVDTNIAGEKTDAVIHKQIHHLALIKDDGSIINQVTITKIHQGIKGEPFTGVRNVDYLRIYVPKGSVLLEAKGFEAPPQELFRKPEDYLKPDTDLAKIEGKILFDEVSGTAINTEFDKTVFGNWVQTDPGETKIVSFTYELPFKISFGESAKSRFDIIKENLGFAKKKTVFYNFFVQKQPGAKAEIISEVKFPYNWQPVWRYPENLQIKDSAWLAHDELSVDHFYGALFEIIK